MVFDKRLPNANIVDTPQRIATDTSQKMAPRYGETIKAYGRDAHKLVYIPLAIAMWCRYLAGATERGGNYYGVNDNLQPVKLSTDGVKNAKMVELARFTSKLDPRKPINQAMVHGALAPILSDKAICGINLYGMDVGTIGFKIESMTYQMLQGQCAVRRTIEKYVMSE